MARCFTAAWPGLSAFPAPVSAAAADAVAAVLLRAGSSCRTTSSFSRAGGATAAAIGGAAGPRVGFAAGAMAVASAAVLGLFGIGGDSSSAAAAAATPADVPPASQGAAGVAGGAAAAMGPATSDKAGAPSATVPDSTAAAGSTAGGTSSGSTSRDTSGLYYSGGQKPDQNPYIHSDPQAERDAYGLPIVPAPKSFAPNVPPPVGNRRHPVHMVLDLNTTTQNMNVSPLHKYTFWTFDGTVPGPMVRCRVGDVVEVRFTNKDADGIGHNIDFHAATGPGGGSAVTYAEAGETKVATFKMMDPGVFIYHCSAAPVPTHIANGMYGLWVVEPADGLPPVDKEFYVLQSEVYAQEAEDGPKGQLEHNYFDGLQEQPMYVIFNGAEGALTDKPLQADQGDRVRIFFGNAGPNLPSAFHVIGACFDKVYREGDLISPPARCVQTTLVPPGGAAAVELALPVPGNYTLVDHAIFRMDKGGVGFLKVRQVGDDRRRDIYDSVEPPAPCPNCKLHN